MKQSGKSTGGKSTKGRPNTAYHKQQSAKAALNRLEALRLSMREGLSCRQIAARLSVSHTSVVNYIRDSLAELNEAKKDEAAVYKEIQSERIETGIEKVMGVLSNDDLEIMTTVENNKTGGVKVITVERFEAIAKMTSALVRLLARQAALHGLDAPAKVEAKHIGELRVTDEQLNKLREARRRILESEANRFRSGQN